MFAIYQLDPETGEATGVIRWFGSLACAQGAIASEDLIPPQYSAPETNTDASDETECEYCGLTEANHNRD